MLNHEELMSNEGLFNKTVYTPLSEAIKILEERKKDKELQAKVEAVLKGNIPEPLKKDGKHAVQFRQIATPNKDTHWFIELTRDHGLNTVFFEYHDDKFTSNNDFKHSLGQLRIHKKINKKGEFIEEKVTVVDFAKYDGEKIKEVLTLWNEPITDFHRRLFDALGHPKEKFFFYDASDWLKDNGEHASGYYNNFLLLFVSHGILFENFLFTGTEGDFTKKVFIPAFERALNLFGLKPLIVPIPPMEYKDDTHWISYDIKIRDYIEPNVRF